MDNNEKVFEEEPLNSSALGLDVNEGENKVEETSTTVEVQPEEVVTSSEPDADEKPVEEEQIVQSEEPVIVEEKPKKKKPILLIIIILVVLAVVGTGVGIYLHLNSTKTIVTNVVNNLYDKFASNVEEVKKFDINEESISLDTDISFKTDIQNVKELNDVKLNLNYGIDLKNKRMEAGLTIDENSKELLSALGYILDDNMYVLFKDMYPSLINIGKTDVSQMFTNSNVTVEDVEYLLKEYKNIFINSLNMDDFEKSSATITLNGKEESVTKLTYVFDTNKQKTLTSNMMNNASESNEFIDRLSKISGTSSSDLKSAFKNTDALDSEDIYTEPSTFIIYVKGLIPELVGMDISNDETNMQIRMNDNDTTITSKYNGNDVVITIKEENDVMKLNLTTVVESKDLNIDVEMTKNKKDDKNYDGVVKLSASYNKQNFEIDVNYKMTIGKKIANVDVSKAKDASTISQIELNNIQQKIYTNLQNSKLYKMIMSLVPSHE